MFNLLALVWLLLALLELLSLPVGLLALVGFLDFLCFGLLFFLLAWFALLTLRS